MRGETRIYVKILYCELKKPMFTLLLTTPAEDITSYGDSEIHPWRKHEVLMGLKTDLIIFMIPKHEKENNINLSRTS